MREREERSGHFVRRGPGKKEEKRKRQTTKKCAVRNFVTLTLNIIKPKFLWT